MDLHDRLKALGVPLGGQSSRPSSLNPDLSLLGGEEVRTPLGPTWVIRTAYPAGHLHGKARLLPPRPAPEVLAHWAGHPELTAVPPEGLVFLDTETSGLTAGAGTLVILVGVGFFRGGTFHLEQIFLRHPADEQALLAHLETLLAPGRAVITYNGKAFDLPLLRTRFRLHGWSTAPCSRMAHVDLLHLVRRLWRQILPDATLLSTEAHLLGSPRRAADIPGWLIPQMYTAYLHSGDPRPLQGVLYHNAMDVVSLAALYARAVEALHAAKPRAGVEEAARARMLEEHGRLAEAEAAYKAALKSADLPEETRRRTRARLAALLKRRGAWDEAVGWWRQAAAEGEIYAFEELAKWLEHQRRDPQAALRWTEAALAQLQNPSHQPHRHRWAAALRRRQARLRRKLGLAPSETQAP